VLFGEYEIVNVLGVGGMGEVYRARHRRLDEHRAIKVMHADLSGKKGATEFFYREAKALLAVRHPAVVHCDDLLSDEAGRVYPIMEMIEGIPLSKKMNDGPLSPDEVAILGARVSHGLSAAHRKGVIHRDVSPDNIVLPQGRVQEAKLIDFGIAKILQEGERTIVDGFKGKLSYASPEQLGFFGGKIDGRSDFYSLGLVLIAAALGRPLSMGTTIMEAVDARRNFDALPDEIPVGLRSAIAPLLKLDPDDRPEYVDRLFVVPGGLEGATDPGRYANAGIPSRATRAAGQSGSRVGLLAGIAAAALLLVAAGLCFAAWLCDLELKRDLAEERFETSLCFAARV
jgi:serine/threonine-protein kinase